MLEFLTNIQDDAAQAVLQELNKRERQKMQRDVKACESWSTHGTEASTMRHGEKKFTIPATSYHYWGKRLGYECWSDAQFVNEFLRDNPQCRVKAKSSKASIIVPGSFAKA